MTETKKASKVEKSENISESRKNSGLAITSFVLGLVAMFLSWIPFVGLIASIIGLIMGIVALVKISKNSQLKGKWMAIVGIILCSILFILALLITIGAIAYFAVLDPSLLPKH